MTEQRAVVSNTTSIVLVIGTDKGQGGEDYHGVGTWTNYTFTNTFTPSQSLRDKASENNYNGSLLIEDNGSIRLMTVDEVPTN